MSIPFFFLLYPLPALRDALFPVSSSAGGAVAAPRRFVFPYRLHLCPPWPSIHRDFFIDGAGIWCSVSGSGGCLVSGGRGRRGRRGSSPRCGRRGGQGALPPRGRPRRGGVGYQSWQQRHGSEGGRLRGAGQGTGVSQLGSGVLTASAVLLRAVLALVPRMRDFAVIWIAREPLVRPCCLCLSRVVRFCSRGSFSRWHPSSSLLTCECHVWVPLPRATARPSFVRCPQAGLGTWRHAAVVSSSDVLAVPKSVPLEVAATLTSGASTALRLLSDFSPLSSGDVVVQSGGESAVGEAVVQLAAKRGVKTVTFVKVRMEAVLFVGVVSYGEAVWSGRSVPGDAQVDDVLLRDAWSAPCWGAATVSPTNLWCVEARSAAACTYSPPPQHL